MLKKPKIKVHRCRRGRVGTSNCGGDGWEWPENPCQRALWMEQAELSKLRPVAREKTAIYAAFADATTATPKHTAISSE